MKNNFKILQIVLVTAVFIGVLWFAFDSIKKNLDKEVETGVVSKFDIELPKTFKDGDNEVKLTWTDDNEGEDLIIQSNQKNYFGVDESIIYFSITNINSKNQEIDLRFLFEDQDASLVSIDKVESVDKKSELKKTTQNLSFGSIKNFKSSNQFQDQIKSKETNYYQAIIKYPAGSKGEFYIESKGDDGAYGILDPWYDSSGLVGYWSMDENELEWGQTSAEVIDKSVSGLDGGSVNMTSGNMTTGKIGNSLSFSTDERVNMGDNLDFDSTDDLSISLWMKRSSNSVTEALLSKNNYDEPGYCVLLQSDGTLRWGAGTNLDSSQAVDDGEWHHVIVIYDYNGSTVDKSIYIDGSLDNSLNTPATMASNPEYLLFGARQDSTKSYLNYYNGALDEVRIYNRTFDSTEVTDLYNHGAMKFKSRAMNDTGLLGYWTMDENELEWGQTSAEVRDKSGNGNNGDSVDMTSGNLVSGKVDGALSFDGSAEYIDVGDNDIFSFGNGSVDTSFTFSVWVYHDDGGLVITKSQSLGLDSWNREYLFWITTSEHKLKMRLYDNGGNTDYIGIVSDNTIGTDGWYHIVGIYDGTGAGGLKFYVNGTLFSSVNDSLGSYTAMANTSSPTEIGRQRNDPLGHTYFDGSIDEVRIYRRALDATEILNLYNDGAKKMKMSHVNDASLKSGLVGNWSMDTKDIDWSASSAEIIDWSDTEAHGDSVNMDSTNNVTGNVGQALSFDGSTEYISVADNATLDLINDFTIAVWAKGTGTGNSFMLSKKNSDYRDTAGYMFYHHPAGIIDFVGKGDFWERVNKAVDSNWHHYVVEMDSGGNVTIYYDGVAQTASVEYTQGSLVAGTDDLWIGRRDTFIGTYADGETDEVRIYNRTLSQAEITALYNLTAQKMRVSN
ncbi:LamG domain-containing protein [Patescibacteria group bacterium]